MIKFKMVLFVFILLIFDACKEANKATEYKPRQGHSARARFDFDFPDTLIIDKVYDGKINYQGILDTITTNLDDEKKYRSIYYYCHLTPNISYSDKELKKVITDSLITDTYNNIPLFNISFNKLGVNYLDGIIVDEVMIDTTLLIDGKMQPRTRIITNEFRATHKVVVIDKK